MVTGCATGERRRRQAGRAQLVRALALDGYTRAQAITLSARLIAERRRNEPQAGAGKAQGPQAGDTITESQQAQAQAIACERSGPQSAGRQAQAERNVTDRNR